MENLTGYCEFLVKKKADGKTAFVRFLLIFLFAAVLACPFVLTGILSLPSSIFMIFVVLWIITGALCYYLFGMTSVEYEYAVVSGYVQLDVIYSKKTRKRLCEAKVSEIKTVAPVSKQNEFARQASKFAKIIDASESKGSDNLYYFVYRDAKWGETLVYINADKKMLDAFSYYNRNAVSRGNL